MEGWDIVLLPEQQSKIFSQKKEKKRDGKQPRDTDCISILIPPVISSNWSIYLRLELLLDIPTHEATFCNKIA